MLCKVVISRLRKDMQNKIIKIITIEINKLIPYSVLWIITGILVGLFLLSATLTSYLEINFFGSSVDFQNYFRFPYIWNTFTWYAGWFNHLLSLLIIILICNEFAFRTFKQGIIDGLARHELVSAKIFVIICFALCYTLIIFLTTLIFGLINTENFSVSIIFKNTHFILLYILQSIAYMSFALMIAFLIKNTALTIIIYLGYIVFEGIIRLFLRFAGNDLLYYLPMKLIGNLINRPSSAIALEKSDFSQYAEGIENIYSGPDLTTTLILAFIYITIFLSTAYFITIKRNFK